MGIIGSIRKHSWIAVAIVGIAIIAFILGDLTKNRSGIPDVGKVDGAVLTSQRFNELVQEMENNYKMQMQTTQVPADAEMQIREQVWQNFVNETLLGEQTDKMGLQVSAAEVNDMFTGTFVHPYLSQIPAFCDPQTHQYDTRRVAQIMADFDRIDTASRRALLEVEQYVKRDRLQQKYSGIIAAGFYMPKAIANQVASYGAEATNLRLAMVPLQSVADEETPLTDADYQEYYNKHKADFKVSRFTQGMADEIRNLKFVAFPVNPTQQDLMDIQADVEKVWAEFQTIPDDEVAFFVNAESDRSYDSTYVKAESFKAPFDEMIAASSAGNMLAPVMAGDEWMMAKVISSAVRPDSLRASTIYILNSNAGGNITRSNDQAKQLADSVLALLNAGRMTFEQAVEQFSDDPQKGETKGDMKWQLDGGYGFLNEKIVNTPVGGTFLFEHPQGVGYFVVKVTDKTPASKKYRVALITREIAPSNNTNRAVYNDALSFAGANRTVKEFEDAVQKDNLQWRDAQIIKMSDNLAGIRNARSVVQWAFDEKTEVGTVANQVYDCDGMFIVPALVSTSKNGYLTLEQVRQTPGFGIERQILNEKKGDLLMARAEEAVKVGGDINSIATKLNVAVDTLEGVSFADYYLGRFGMEPKVQAVATAAKSGIAGPVKGANGVYVLQVDGKSPREAVNADMVKAQLEQGYGSKMRSVTHVLKENAKITDQRNKFF